MQLLPSSWSCYHGCRKRIAKEKGDVNKPTKNSTSEATTVPIFRNGKNCYGCGKEGYFRSDCPNCSGKPTLPAQSVNLYYFRTLQNVSTQVPTIRVAVKGFMGLSHLDTAAKTSVAGRSLYECLKEIPGVVFHTQ